LKKSIKDTRESLSAEIKPNYAKIKNVLAEMQSKPDALTSRVNEAEESKMIERKKAKEKREKQLMDHERRL